MLVALTVTPALCLSCSREASSDRARVAAAARAQARLRRGARRRSSAGRARRSLPAAVLPAGRGCSSCPTLGQSAAAELQGARLPHALADPAGHVGAGGDADLGARPARTCARSPGVRNCGSHIGQALLADEVVRRRLRRELDQRRPRRRLRQDARGRRTGRSRAIPGLYRDVQTYLRERIKEVLTGTERVHRGPDLRPRPRRCCATKAEEIAEKIADIDGRGRRAPRASGRSARTSRSSSTSPRRGDTGSSRATSAGSPSTLLASEEVSDIFYGGKAYDVHVWSIPSARDSVTDVENLPIDTPAGRPRPAGATSPTCASRRRRTTSSASSSRAGSTSARTSRVATSAGRRRRRGRASSEVDVPARATTRRCSASRRS